MWPFALWVAARNQAPWGDEAHFLVTVRQFGDGLSLELLRSYDELSAPLTYIVYAAWGHLVGFETAHLRLLSPALASLMLFAYSRVLAHDGVNTQASMGALGVTALNPYFVGLSAFVFTDMLALLGMVMVWSGVQSGRPLVSAVGLAGATLTRQYSAFLAAAIVIMAVLANGNTPRQRMRWVAVAVVGMIPLGALVMLWGWSLSPVTYLRERYLADGLRFDPHAASLYLAAPGVYLFPLALVTLRQAQWTSWVAGLVVAMWVVLVPVQASPAQLGDGISTVGFAHRAFVAVLGDSSHLGFVVAAIVGSASVTTWFVAEWARWSGHARTTNALFPWLALLSFGAMMPFSFQPWEKYALPQLVLCAGLFARYHCSPPDNRQLHKPETTDRSRV
jgi:hypothetical protein